MNVLIVDDNEALADNLRELLEDDGHEVRVASSVASARDHLARGRRFNLALIDVRLGCEDGVGLACELRAANPNLRLALMTAFTNEEDLARAHSEGRGPVLAKPVPLGTLAELTAA